MCSRCLFFSFLPSLNLFLLSTCPFPLPPFHFCYFSCTALILSPFFPLIFSFLHFLALSLAFSSCVLLSSSCAHSKSPLNCYFLQCSAGLLFAGLSQVNCVCSFSICFCVSDRVNILKWGQYQVMATEGTQLKMSIFLLLFFSVILCFSVFELR